MQLTQIDNVMFYKKKYIHWYFCTCWEVFIDWPVIHLQCSIATIPGKADNMILSIIYWGATLLHTDVHCANVKGYSNLALLLKERKNEKKQFWHCLTWCPGGADSSNMVWQQYSGLTTDFVFSLHAWL